MHLKPFLCCTFLLVLLALPVMAAEPLAPRGEVSVKGGTDRSLLTTEFWAPLAQQSDRVLYGDIRLMGDNDENREGNLGVGYRQIKNNAVVGVHGWIDRRRTQHNSTFHQLTFGVERLGHIVDARANIYIPINNGRTIITPNIGVTSPYLAGSGIYYDTNGSINETPQYGLDGELGYRIPVFQKQVDAIRVYGGGYYFFRDNTTEVPGARFRTEAQINKAVSVGARVQYDKPRGTQGFLEATLKFPFSAKRLYQESGIRSRLDESPERDVDIVTESKVTDTGLRKPVIDAVTGTQQRILYVDNTKADGGDGSYEKPFNNLKAAEAALQANDILYINRGDGTTRNMNQGIVIDKPNVQLIGSATPLTYGGVTFLNAGAAPVITNIQTPVNGNEIIGNGVTVLADESLISGLTITGATSYGIRVAAIGANAQFNDVRIYNNTLLNSGQRGIIIHTQQNGHISNIDIQNNTSSGNSRSGIMVQANSGSIGAALIQNNNTGNNPYNGIESTVLNGGIIDTLTIKNNSTNNNTTANGRGISISASSLGAIKNIVAANNTIANNANVGIGTFVAGGTILNMDINHNTVTNNGNVGLYIISQNANSTIDNLIITNNVTTGNITNGIQIYALSSGTAVINNFTVANNVSSNNTGHGLLIQARDSARLGTAIINNNTLASNSSMGVYTLIQNSAILSSLSIDKNTTSNNNSTGIMTQATASGTISTVSITENISNSNTSTAGYGVRLYANSSGAVNSAMVANNTASNNSKTGFYISADGGALNSITVDHNSMSSNADYGMWVQTVNTVGSVITNAKAINNSITSNLLSGVYLQKVTSTTFDLDMGGGLYGATGGNRIFGNTGTEVRVDGGYALSARTNYWGGGDLVTGEKTLNGGSTVDSTGFLTVTP